MHHLLNARLNAMDSRWRPRQMRGDVRMAPPPQSVLKHSSETNERAQHVGAFRSAARPCGTQTTARRSRRRRHDHTASQSLEDRDPHSNTMEAVVESAPLIAYTVPRTTASIDDDALPAPSNATPWDVSIHTMDGVRDGEGGLNHISQVEKRVRWTVILSITILLALAGLGTGVTLAIVLRGGNVQNSEETGPGSKATCGVEAVYELCRDNQQQVFQQLPLCLVDRYRHVRQYVPLFDNNNDFLLGERSCHPTNLALWSIAATAPTNATAISILHRYVLGTLFFETMGPSSWTRSDKWLTAESECSWYGIGCNGDQSALEVLSLPENRLEGPIPSQLGLLPALRES